jgi:hypothetical protein
VRIGRKHRVDGRILIQKIRHQDLDDDTRVSGPDRFDGLAKMFGAAIRQIIPGHRCDHDVFERHATRGFRHPRRFVGFQRERFGRGDRAEPAGPGATVPCDHKGGGAFAPTFPVIRAFGALANGVQTQIRQQIAGLAERVGSRKPQPQPFRDARTRSGGIRQLCCVHQLPA